MSRARHPVACLARARLRTGSALAALGMLLALPVRGGVEWGGVIPEGREQNVRLMLGAVLKFEGVVNETTRRLYDVTGATWSQADAEGYDINDFNLDGPFGTVGLSFESAWKYLRLQIDTAFLNPSTETTARRDYYLAVGKDIEYNGRSYDHLMIPEGTPFEADLIGNMTEVTMQFVPVGFQAGDFLSINPSLGLGLILFGGQYDIDAGETTGVKTYQNPPEDFAVGGSSSGLVGIGAPQWGGGVEVRLGRPDGVVLDVEVQYLMSEYDGSTAWLTTADHREKNLDFDHRNLRVRGQVELPAGSVVWLLGVQVQWVETEGLVSSTATTPADVLALRERFDKEFKFSVNSAMATLGVAF